MKEDTRMNRPSTWIRFADKYPPKETLVLLTDHGSEEIRPGEWDFDDEGLRDWCVGGDYYDGDFDENGAPFTYWMHIPALPKEGEAIEEVEILAELRPTPSETERRTWTRGFFNALACHCDGADLQEGVGSTGLASPAEALAAGAEEQDVQRVRFKGGWTRFETAEEHEKRRDDCFAKYGREYL